METGTTDGSGIVKVHGEEIFYATYAYTRIKLPVQISRHFNQWVEVLEIRS